jgi:hypothetical protein
MSDEKRKSKVMKRIKRIYNVARFESLELEIYYEDDIEWADVKERQEKCNTVTKLLISDFEKTRKDVMTELNESEKKAYFVTALKSMDAEYSEDSLM